MLLFFWRFVKDEYSYCIFNDLTFHSFHRCDLLTKTLFSFVIFFFEWHDRYAFLCIFLWRTYFSSFRPPSINLLLLNYRPIYGLFIKARQLQRKQPRFKPQEFTVDCCHEVRWIEEHEKKLFALDFRGKRDSLPALYLP